MKPIILLGCASAFLLSSGCTSHLVFMEESHTGLKIRAGGSTPSPYEVGFGYRRGMVAAVPKQYPCTRSKDGTDCPVKPEHKHDDQAVAAKDSSGPNGSKDPKPVIIHYDPNELMSLYAEFCANIGFNEPIEFHNLMVTGDAAIWLLSDANHDLRDSLGEIMVCDPKPSEQPAK
jgi:hypothetical protein